MKTRKILALLLVLVMMAGLLCTSAFATETTNLDVTGNTGVSSIVASTPVTVDGVLKSYTTSSFQYNNQTYTNYQYTYNIALPYTATDGSTVGVTFTRDNGAIPAPVPPLPQFFNIIGGLSDNTTYTRTTTLSNGTASIVAYVHKDFANVKNWCDTYTFQFAVEYPVSISAGDPVYIAWTDNSGTVTGRDGSTFIPQSFTLYAKTSSITVDGVTKNYDGVDPSGSGDYYYTITTKASGNTVIKATVNSIEYTVTCPHYTSLSAGTAPFDVVSYLPIGQYATGGGWGTSNGKFANKTSLDSTGVSLGALGGYIEFDFDNPATTTAVEGITNDPRNPYGVDFVVYGNAFAGNPEAGAVQVGWEHDGTVTWYELAGSRYYDGNYFFAGNQGATGKFSNAYTGTLRNTTVSYALGANDIKVTLGSNGPNPFTTNTAWWPLTDEEYPMGTPHTNSLVTVSHSNTALSFGGVTAVQDSNVTADYAFGYADVTPNGSPSILGDAVNPYTAYTSSKTGGDGFDLEWAVDISTGLPVDVTGKTFRYVRVYSAVLDNGTFGETSTEVCGIFTAYRTETEEALDDEIGVGRTNTATIYLGNSEVSTVSGVQVSTFGDTVVYDTGGLWEDDVISVTGISSGANVYINNINATTYTVAEDDQMVRVIVQSGDAAPFIAIIK